MTNSSRWTCLASLLSMALLSCAASGCASMNGASEKWTAAWKKDTKPPGNDPNHEEVVSYWGQKKKTPKHVEMSPELKERLAKRTEERQTKSLAESLRDGNQRLKEGRLDESRRAFEQALVAKPDDADAHHGLAVIADKQQLFGVADNHYESALKKQPRNPNLLNDIGYSHWLRGGDQQAEKMLLEALAVEPGHKGATLNLSTLYGKQGRYEDAYALLRKGATESETKQYMAKLFPQGRPSGAGSPDGTQREQDFAMNQPGPRQRSALPMPADDRLADSSRTDSGRMTREQLRPDLERRPLENAPQRPSTNDQIPSSRDGVAPRGGWGDSLVQDQRPRGDQRPVLTSNDREWPRGNGDNSYPGPGSQNVLPSGGQFQSDPAAMLPYPGSNSNGFVQQEPQSSYSAAPSQESLTAPPGTKPHSNIPFWQGAPVVRGNATSHPTSQPSTPNGSPWGPQTPGASQRIEQTNFTDEGTRAGHAAAQLGMSIGGMFPVISSDSGSTGGSFGSPSATTAPDPRFGGEFHSQPQNQNPGQYSNGGPWSQGGPAANGQNSPNEQNSGVQTAPYYPSNQNGSPNRELIQQMGGSEPNADSLSAFAASKRPRGVSSGWGNSTQSNSSMDNIPIAPESPANSLSRPWNSPANFGSGQTQGSDPTYRGEPTARANTGPDSASPDGNSGRTSRYAKAPWDEPAIVPNSQPNGSRPFNGAWPNGGSQPAGDGSNNGAAPNSIPMWNGGSNSGQPVQNGGGPSSNGAPQQWSYPQGR